MNNERLKYLLKQYFDDTISSDDCIQLLEYIKDNPEQVSDTIDEESLKLHEGPGFNSARAGKVLDAIKTDPRFKQPAKQQARVISMLKRLAKIAAVLVFISAIAFYFIHRNKPASSQNQFATHKPSEILPGSNKAVLTLSNGEAIVLNNTANGTLAQTGKIQVNKVANGKLVYGASPNHTGAKTNNNSLIYNTLTTPRGGEYQIVLPDGTHVWLNAASSISYPVEFTANERRVKLTGEAYFEVAKNKDKPFYVATKNQTVEVLGTHFNINSYEDEADIKTTLLEGSVKVSVGKNRSILKPGQQAVTGSKDAQNGKAGSITIKNNVDLDQVTAWRYGLFNFNKVSLQEVMRQVARWYDVEIEYQGQVKPRRFGGEIQRDLKLTEVLEGLEQTGIHFRIEGRRLIVLP